MTRGGQLPPRSAASCGRDPEAITMLEEMKRKTKDPVFAYQDSSRSPT